MTYPAFDTSHIAEAIDGRSGPITCSACGCRLQRAANGEEVWFHFAPDGRPRRPRLPDRLRRRGARRPRARAWWPPDASLTPRPRRARHRPHATAPVHAPGPFDSPASARSGAR